MKVLITTKESATLLSLQGLIHLLPSPYGTAEDNNTHATEGEGAAAAKGALLQLLQPEPLCIWTKHLGKMELAE